MLVYGDGHKKPKQHWGNYNPGLDFGYHRGGGHNPFNPFAAMRAAYVDAAESREGQFLHPFKPAPQPSTLKWEPPKPPEQWGRLPGEYYRGEKPAEVDRIRSDFDYDLMKYWTDYNTRKGAGL